MDLTKSPQSMEKSDINTLTGIQMMFHLQSEIEYCIISKYNLQRNVGH